MQTKEKFSTNNGVTGAKPYKNNKIKQPMQWF